MPPAVSSRAKKKPARRTRRARDPSPASPGDWNPRLSFLLVLALILAYGIVLVRTAWVCDDSYITFRTVDNFVNGYGLRWNVDERVQSYTNPLWMFLVAGLYALTGEIYLSVIALSIVLSVSAVALVVLGAARSSASAWISLAVLLSSKAFIDYSTSGLENPLTYLLSAVFFIFYARREDADGRRVFLVSLVAALAALNRMDTILLFLPALAYLGAKTAPRRALVSVIAGFAPLLIWELFSLVYYGFPFPNTAYAKLDTGIRQTDLIAQGIRYLANSLSADPPALLAVVAGVVTPFVIRKERVLPLSAGIVLYVFYAVWVGGDFMSGRLLAVPFFWSAALVAQLPFHTKGAAAAVAGILVLFFVSPSAPLLSGGDFGEDYPALALARDGFRSTHGIADERRFYYPDAGLLPYLRAGRPAIWPRLAWVDQALELRESGRTFALTDVDGFAGFFSGPRVHLLDVMALGDPLLARLPVADPRSWRIGHFQRTVPEGYPETIVTGSNKIRDRNTAVFYDKLSLITQGPLFDPARLEAVWEMNLGKYDNLLKRSTK